MIFVIDDDEIMAECIARALAKSGFKSMIFGDAISAMAAIADGEMPEMIFLDILLDGPDGWTFLNEMISYPDTSAVPIVVVSSLDLAEQDLSVYGVVAVLHKDTMHPAEITALARRYAK